MKKNVCLFLYLFGIILITPLYNNNIYAADWFAATVEIIPVHEGEKIQDAIDKSKEGGVILVSPGVYYETIVLKKKAILRSEAGAEKTIINGSKGASTVVQMAADSTLDGFTITGRAAADKAHAIECVGVSAIIKNNLVRENNGTGIFVSGEKAAPQITNNQCYNNAGAGIGVENKGKPAIIGNKCYGNAHAGIGVQLGAAPVVKNNECFKNKMAGIGVRNKESAPVIENNQCHDNELSGIGLEKQANVTLKNNALYNNGRAGIGLHESSTAHIEGNKIEKNTLSGIGAQEKSKITVISNEIKGNVMAGITVLDGTIADIQNNNVQANGTQGIICSSAIANIKNNQIIDNIHHGIGFYRKAKGEISDNTIVNNGATDKRGSGILMVSSDDPIIKRNQFENNYGPGVYTRSCSPLIEENTFTNDLVFVKFNAAPTIKKNVFYAAGKSGGKTVKSGVDVREVSAPIIEDNEFYGKFGVSIREKSNALVIGNKFSGSHKDSISSARSGVKVDRNSSPSIVNNAFYNGNKLLISGKAVTKNMIISRAVSADKKAAQTVDFKPEDHGKDRVIIAGNIFLGTEKSDKSEKRR